MCNNFLYIPFHCVKQSFSPHREYKDSLHLKQGTVAFTVVKLTSYLLFRASYPFTSFVVFSPRTRIPF